MLELRPYQRAAINSVNAYLSIRVDNPCIWLPTGSGKSVVMAAMIAEYLQTWPDTRIAILAHVQELVAQNAEKLYHAWPKAPLGIYSAGLGRREIAPVTFGNIQSLYRRARDLGPLDLVFVDEAHRIPTNGEGMYRTFLKQARHLNSALRVIGFTATPYRLGVGMVVGEDRLFASIAYEAPVKRLIEDGYLCRLTSRGGTARADVSGVAVRGGEYVAHDLEVAVLRGDVVTRAVAEFVELCRDRKAWLIFCAGVEHANRVSRQLENHGVEAPVISYETPKPERATLIERFRKGALRALCNVNVLSEGFDVPHVDAIVMLRPTMSAGLYYQQVGRGLRIAPGKTDCLVLDYAGNVLMHGPIDTIRVRDSRGGEVRGEPVRECPECHHFVPIGKPECPHCGYVFPVVEREVKHAGTAADVDIVSRYQPPVWVTVSSVRYHHHIGRSGKPTLQVTYECGLRSYLEWVAFEHEGIARTKAEKWWRERCAGDLPVNVVEALARVRELREPKKLQVDFNGRYPEIKRHVFVVDAASEEAGARVSGGSDGDRVVAP